MLPSGLIDAARNKTRRKAVEEGYFDNANLGRREVAWVMSVQRAITMAERLDIPVMPGESRSVPLLWRGGALRYDARLVRMSRPIVTRHDTWQGPEFVGCEPNGLFADASEVDLGPHTPEASQREVCVGSFTGTATHFQTGGFGAPLGHLSYDGSPGSPLVVTLFAMKTSRTKNEEIRNGGQDAFHTRSTPVSSLRQSFTFTRIPCVRMRACG